MKSPSSSRGVVRIRYMSDLHLEQTYYAPDVVSDAGEDLVVLAGDIGIGTRGIEWATKAFPGTPVLYVLGNHEFCENDFDDLVIEARKACAGTNVTLLERDSFYFRGIRFLGATLWTDFCLKGAGDQGVAMTTAQEIMIEYREVRRGDRMLRPEDTLQRHQEAVRWLSDQLPASSEPTVVVTHHAPTYGPARNPRFPLSLTSAVFHSDLDALLQAPVRAWIFGHTHCSIAHRTNGTWLLSNQRGYFGERTDFDWNRVIEVELEAPTNTPDNLSDANRSR